MKTLTASDYFSTAEFWKDEIAKLRDILLSAELDETVKWGMPTYTLDGKNIVGIGAFKSYFGLWFFQGVLLKDRQNVLINAQKGRTGALRQWRFTSAEEIDTDRVRAYVLEAIGNRQSGREVKPGRQKELQIPTVLQAAFDHDPQLKSAFQKLTPGRQREYANWIAEAKRETTRQDRIRKVSPMIISGMGLNDRYRK